MSAPPLQPLVPSQMPSHALLIVQQLRSRRLPAERVRLVRRIYTSSGFCNAASTGLTNCISVLSHARGNSLNKDIWKCSPFGSTPQNTDEGGWMFFDPMTCTLPPQRAWACKNVLVLMRCTGTMYFHGVLSCFYMMYFDARGACVSTDRPDAGGLCAEREAMLKMYGMAMEALNLDQRPPEADVADVAGGDLMGGADGPAAEAAAMEGARRDLIGYDGCVHLRNVVWDVPVMHVCNVCDTCSGCTPTPLLYTSPASAVHTRVHSCC